MKIAQITTVFPPFRGGMSQVPYQHARELVNLGHEVEVLTPDYGFGRIETDFYIDYLRPWLKWGLGALCPQILFKLKKYDVLELHQPAFGLGIFVALWKLFTRSKIKLIMFYHMDNFGSGIFKVLYPLYNLLLRPIILSQADIILVSSFDYIAHSGIKNYYQKNQAKFRELSFGATADFVPKDRNVELLRKFNIPEDKKIILFVGGMGPEHYFKGVTVLLEACSQIEDQVWHLVCVGKGSLIVQYQRQARDLGIEANVTFTDFQPDDLLADWYSLATVTVLPSIDSSEAFGIVLVEAMACASPVIASDLPGVRIVVEHEANGLVAKSGDTHDLAMRIRQILASDELQHKFSQQALQIAQTKYRWPEIVKKLNAIIKE